MKEWIVVKFTGTGNMPPFTAARAGDVTIWPDYTNSGMVYDSPAYEVVYRTSDFKEAQAVARHERMHKYPRLTHADTFSGDAK